MDSKQFSSMYLNPAGRVHSCGTWRTIQNLFVSANAKYTQNTLS